MIEAGHGIGRQRPERRTARRYDAGSIGPEMDVRVFWIQRHGEHRLQWKLLPGEIPGDKRIGVTMAQLVFGLEMAHQIHVLERTGLLQHLHPVLDGWPYFFSMEGK